ncbi:hypothetical protein PHJA_002919500, partial [Phtheirospermum japonicum]
VIGEIGTAEYSVAKLQLIRWSGELQRHWKSSPYFYEDRRLRPEKAQAEKPDIERYSDRNLPKTNVKLELRDWIMLDQDHVPAELAEGGKRKRRLKKIKWNPDLGKDIFDKLEKMSEGKEEETDKKEDEEEEEEEDENEEEDGEISDEGDYEQGVLRRSLVQKQEVAVVVLDNVQTLQRHDNVLVMMEARRFMSRREDRGKRKVEKKE